MTDTASGSATTPAGTVSFFAGTHKSNFTPVGSCTLAVVGVAQASCSLSFPIPLQLGSGTQTVHAIYGGDSNHGVSDDSLAVFVLRATNTTVSCGKVLPVLSQCTATVNDISLGTASVPAGTVSFISSGPGIFSALQCTLSNSGTSAVCAVDYAAPAGVPFADQTITASYGGDGTHQGSTGSFTFP